MLELSAAAEWWGGWMGCGIGWDSAAMLCHYEVRSLQVAWFMKLPEKASELNHVESHFHSEPNQDIQHRAVVAGL